MGVMRTLKIMRQLLPEWTLPEKMTVTWDIGNRREVTYAQKKFCEYLADGWMAFSEEPKGRRQIFTFNPQLERIVLIPPLGGG
ncbi:MAG: hypothetical protein NWF13_09845 [Candidatus Bathyarchaeota archaeon]|nr:hypothetical protein [Candidatus Bathyarchaeota archaeon]